MTQSLTDGHTIKRLPGYAEVAYGSRMELYGTLEIVSQPQPPAHIPFSFILMMICRQITTAILHV